jgi:transposase-like protein
MRLVNAGPPPRIPEQLFAALGDPADKDVRQRRTLVKQAQTSSVNQQSELQDDLDLEPISKTEIGRRRLDAEETLRRTLAERPLDRVSVAAVLIDGTPVGRKPKGKAKTKSGDSPQRTVAWALGITTDGTKLPLGIVEGPTETAALFSELLDGIHARGLDTKDALWVIDGGLGLRSAVRKLSRNVVIQRCTVHKDRNIISDNLSAEDRERIGEGQLRRDLQSAWREPDHERAATRLTEIAKGLRDQGHVKAADSVVEGAEWTLTLQRLGVHDRDLVRAVGTTNNIESVHRAVSERKRRITRWRQAPDKQRQRCVAAAVATAEPKWGKAVADPSGLERLSLAVLASRHPDVKLSVEREAADRSVLIAQLDGEQPKLYRALSDLRAWAQRNGTSLDIPDHVIEAVPRPDRLRAWIERETTGQISRDARPKQRPVDPLAVVRDGVDERLAVPIAEAALAAAPEIVAATDRELKSEAAALWAARDDLRTVEADVQTWWTANWRLASREIALQRERMMRGEQPWQHPLEGGRAEVLGQERADWLMGESAYQGGLIEGAPPKLLADYAREIGSRLAGLDEPAARVTRAGRTVAANRELDRRELLRQVVVQPHETAKSSPAKHPPPEAAGVAPLDRYAHALGQRRRGLLQRHADALAPQLEDLDAAALNRLTQEVGQPWDALSKRDALQTAVREDRVRPALLDERRDTLRTMAHWQRRADQTPRRRVKGALDHEVDACRNTARGQWVKLREINAELDADRAHDRSLDGFIAEHPEAALHHAIHVEFERRRELEAPEQTQVARQEPALTAEPAIGVEM